MPWSPARRRWTFALAIGLLLLAAAFVALQLALRSLPAQVTRALGPRASVGSIEAGWRGVEIRQLVIRAEAGRWPAEHELRAERVTVQPALASLWGGPWRVARVEVEGAYLSMLRGRDGHLVMLPSLTAARGTAEPHENGDATPGLRLRIDAVSLRDASLDFFDASVAAPRGAPLRLRLADLRADVGPIAWPALDETMTVTLAATFKGVQRDGKIAIEGQLTPATREAALQVTAQGVDLVTLQPYLLKRGEGAVQRGSLDLTLSAQARAQRLHAPGHLVIHGLELASGGGMLGTFGGVPRQAVLAAMSRDGKIELDFTLEGRLDDPKFSVNDLFAARFAVGLAEKLGVSLGGVVEGLGGVIKGLFGK